MIRSTDEKSLVLLRGSVLKRAQNGFVSRSTFRTIPPEPLMPARVGPLSRMGSFRQFDARFTLPSPNERKSARPHLQSALRAGCTWRAARWVIARRTRNFLFARAARRCRDNPTSPRLRPHGPRVHSFAISLDRLTRPQWKRLMFSRGRWLDLAANRLAIDLINKPITLDLQVNVSMAKRRKSRDDVRRY